GASNWRMKWSGEIRAPHAMSLMESGCSGSPPAGRERGRDDGRCLASRSAIKVCYPKRPPHMYIRKQRLLTPGPTPLYPPALHAMMASDIHHRTEDFRKIYRSCLADLKEVMGTSNDVVMFAASGTGAMDAAVSKLFSKG